MGPVGQGRVVGERGADPMEVGGYQRDRRIAAAAVAAAVAVVAPCDHLADDPRVVRCDRLGLALQQTLHGAIGQPVQRCQLGEHALHVIDRDLDAEAPRRRGNAGVVPCAVGLAQQVVRDRREDDHPIAARVEQDQLVLARTPMQARDHVVGQSRSCDGLHPRRS